MKVLVTGGAGFVGAHVVYTLINRGIEEDIADKRQEIDPVDLASDPLDAIVHNVDAIIHCAARADIRSNWSNYAEREALHVDNYLALVHLLEAAISSPSVKRFVFVSTGGVYAGCSSWVHEYEAVRATSPYSASKLAGESWVQAYAERAGWRWYAVRPAACFGPGYHHGHVADFVNQVRQTGRIHALDDGWTPRPALHVQDLAEALVDFATLDIESGIYNLASEATWSWRGTASLMGVEATYEERPSGWVGDSKGAMFDARKAIVAGLPAPMRSIAQGVKESLASMGWEGA